VKIFKGVGPDAAQRLFGVSVPRRCPGSHFTQQGTTDEIDDLSLQLALSGLGTRDQATDDR
jgi:hypothetical protein